MKSLAIISLFFCLASCGSKAGGAEARPTSPPAELQPSAVPAQEDFPEVVYTKNDSAAVVALLADSVVGDEVLYYARKFIGVPYVAHTLEISDPEKLVVNLREMDCTTLVETVAALALTKRAGERSFAAYCNNLEKLRYREGKMKGYLSRLHYFTWWMHDNISKGTVQEISDATHFTSPMRVNNYYMSLHPDKYKMLQAHPEWTEDIRRMEEEYNKADGTYLPKSATNLSQAALDAIRDGDIVAIVTSKKGLDYSHLGFAVWGKDGKLHLLNASSIHKKVVEEPMTLYEYLRKHPSSLGIRLLRLK